MIWFLILHIIALLMWGGGILYLPMLLSGGAQNEHDFATSPPHHDSMARFVYTHIATPAALIGIVAGTIVFWLNFAVEFWLIAKLTVVTVLAVTHASIGLLIIRAERQNFKFMRLFCWAAAAILVSAMASILYLVLAKPGVPEALPWTL